MMKSILVAVGLCVSASAMAANDDQLQTEQAQLIERLAELNTLQADFVQLVKDANGELVQQLQGAMVLKRPNKLIWQTDAPDETLLVANGETLWYHNAFIEQVTIYDQAEAVAQSPLLLLLDADNSDWQNYDVAIQTDAGEHSYTITPKDSAQNVSSLTLQFAEGAILSRITLDDGQGQVSEIGLSNQVMNERISDLMFDFEIPANTDIDDQRTLN